VLFIAGKIKTTPGSFSHYAVRAYVLFSIVPIFGPLFQIMGTAHAPKTLEDIKKKILELKEQTAKPSAALTAL
jgi:uncharacterized BrkB/YihY/UPF0761 family membrane protein